MIITVSNKTQTKTNCVVVPFQKTGKLKDTLSAFAKSYQTDALQLNNTFTAEEDQSLILFSGSKKIFLLGLGESPDFRKVQDSFRLFAFRQMKQLSSKITVDLSYWLKQKADISPEEKAEAAANGLSLSNYQLGIYKTAKNGLHPFNQRNAKLHFYINNKSLTSVRKAVERGQSMAKTQKRIFDLVNGAANKVTPKHLGNWAKASGKTNGFKVKVLNKAQIEKTGLGALLAVNRGSEYPPSFIIMEYLPKGIKSKKGLKKIGLVGKGVTFDTGGLSIKGSLNMHYMKSDMGGAAAVLGAMEIIAKTQLRAHVVGIVPATDNCVDAKATKPGDIIHSYSGKTIEMIDTDAEGRLILADGLAYMEKHFKPDVMINLATLTGSVVRTLGYHAGGLFTKNDELARTLSTSGSSTGERLWRLPLWDDYKRDMDSDVADIKNYSGRPVAGGITAGKFLEFFTNEHPAWAHLDIAGVAFKDNDYGKQKNATAFGVRLLWEFVKQHS